MKVSSYAKIFPLEDDYIIFNTLSGAICKIDKETKEFLMKDLTKIEGKIAETLRKTEVLVDDDLDEKSVYKYRYDNLKYHNKSASFLVVTTYACNFSCPYCYEGQGRIRSDSMNDETVGNVVKFIQNVVTEHGCRHIHLILYGGEPLLNLTACKKLLEEVRSWASNNEIGFKGDVTSNGSLFSDETIKMLKKGLDQVSVSLDGPKAIHDKRRVLKNGQGTYDLIMEAVEKIRKNDLKLQFLINVDKESEDHIEELLDDLKRRRFEDIPIHYLFLGPYSEFSCAYPHHLPRDEHGALINQLRRKSIEKGWTLSLKQLRLKPMYLPCPFLSMTRYVVGPFGDLYKCWAHLGMKEHCVGSIDKDGKIIDMNPSYYSFMARDPLLMKCRDCSLLPLCGGGCPALALEQYGTYHREYCYASSILERIRLFLSQG